MHFIDKVNPNLMQLVNIVSINTPLCRLLLNFHLNYYDGFANQNKTIVLTIHMFEGEGISVSVVLLSRRMCKIKLI